jgi:hypothetical protein
MLITIEEERRLEESIGKLPDAREQKRDFRHKLVDIVIIAFTAVLCGLDEYEEIEEFGREKEEWFKKFLELPHGIPDEIPFYRVLRVIDPGKLAEALNEWLFEVKPEEGQEINIDGKTM